MFNDIKNKFRKFGFISIELVILASVMLTAGGYGVAKLGNNASGATKNENGLFNSLFGKEDEQLPDYVVKINEGVRELYDVGENSLTADDVITINGIDCYVLKKEEGKALLITKDIYDVRFDTGGHTAEETTHLGTGSYADKTYDYYYSTLRTWMGEFYRTQLGADPRILPTTVTYYTSDVYASDLNSYATGTIANQYVFALDAKEAKQYVSKFKWTRNLNYNYAFWTTAGYRRGSDSNAWLVNCNSGFNYHYVDSSFDAARPAFWISLS